MLRVRLRGAALAYAALLGAFFSVPAVIAAPEAVTAYRLPVAATPDGSLSLYAEERGHGTPVVLIHGLGGSTYSWRFIAPALARTHKVIAVDLKGFGRSDKVFDTAYSPLDQARLVAAFLAGRGLRNVTLVGHSLGGLVAMLTTIELQRRDPTRISRLVLIDTPALPQPLTSSVMFMQQPVLPYALLTALPPDLATRMLLAPTVTQRLARHYTQADADAYARPFYDAAARHAYIQTARQLVLPSITNLLRAYRTLRQPTLLVWCTHDEVVPLSTGRALASMLPHARLEQLDGCNHAPTDEAPDALSRSLVRFLN